MSDPRWARIQEIFEGALTRKAGAEREAFLDRACGAERGLRAEVGSLLDADARGHPLLDAPALRAAFGRGEDGDDPSPADGG